jgi:thioredoxin reductase (NADPH)
MDYVNVPTTVFTPLEYGTCGLTEEDAKKKYGEENIATYHTQFKPLEWAYDKTAGEGKRTCYTKIVCNKSDSNRVLGFHICSPNAGEITQGVAIGFKCNFTKEQLDSVVGIHPTIAEEVIGLKWTKEEKPDASKSGC